jgi:DNA-directed RNA polymerase subunit RPC12/RpoP
MLETATAVRVRFQHGDVECVNCGRTLARAQKRLTDGAIRLGPCMDGTLGVELHEGHRLRCCRCGGRAFIEFDNRLAG